MEDEMLGVLHKRESKQCKAFTIFMYQSSRVQQQGNSLAGPQWSPCLLLPAASRTGTLTLRPPARQDLAPAFHQTSDIALFAETRDPKSGLLLETAFN